MLASRGASKQKELVHPSLASTAGTEFALCVLSAPSSTMVAGCGIWDLGFGSNAGTGNPSGTCREDHGRDTGTDTDSKKPTCESASV